MNNRLTCLLLVLSASFCAVPLFAQGTQTERVLIVGDSWAELTWNFHSLDEAFTWSGHADKVAVGDVTALGGTTAEEWNTISFQALIQQELAAHPAIDVIHLSIGGNDFLGAWNTLMSKPEEQVLWQEIADDVENLIAYIHSLDPTLEIVYTGYDYMNMDEMLAVDFFGWLRWVFLGFPSPETLNHALADLSTTLFQRLSLNPKVHFINHTGLMQWVFGYPSLGLAPRTVTLPGNESGGWRPLVGGDPFLPSPPEAMLDSIHLNNRGYDAIARHCTIHFYDAWFDAHP